MILTLIGITLGIATVGAASVRIVRPTERALVETLGKYSRFANPGLHIIIPFIQNMVKVDTTEAMAEVDSQEIITEDKLNADVDLVIFYKVKDDEDSVKKTVYQVRNFEKQIVVLAQTAARDVMGSMPFSEVNSKRGILNSKLKAILALETKNWGVDIVRVELRDIVPPKDVQDTMNKVLKAQNEKRAAIDTATALETQADGVRRAKIKEAEGERQAAILKAEGQSKAFNLVNSSFKGNAQLLKKLEVTQSSLENNSKIILTTKGIDPQIIMGDLPFRNNSK